MITTKEARTILKDYGKNLKDVEIEKIISFLYRLSDKIIEKELCKTIASQSSKPYN